MSNTGQPSLPPGSQEQATKLFFRKRDYLLEKYSRLGQVFAEKSGENLLVYVIGFPTIHRLLADHSDNLDAMWMDLTPLFAQGHIRTLRGANHQLYRRAILKAVNSDVLTQAERCLTKTVSSGLEAFYTSASANEGSGPYRKTLDDIATAMLVRLFYGQTFGSSTHNELVKLHQQLGPNGLAWVIDEPEKQNFSKIKTLLEKIIAEQPQQSTSEGVIQAIDPTLRNDETMIGNLIYMVETGRGDIQALLRWVSKFACEFPSEMAMISAEGFSLSQSTSSRAESFINETLRMAQSERTQRRVMQDIEFNGMLIPKESILNLCLWESHQLAESFDQPRDFKVERFLQNQFGSDKYSPFGIGTHRCPMNNYVPKIAALFLSMLASEFELEGINNGAPMRGLYHWQPNDKFTVAVKPRVTKP